MSFSTENLWLFLGIGLALIGLIAGAILFRKRKSQKPVEVPDPDLDQTCELNYTPE